MNNSSQCKSSNNSHNIRCSLSTNARRRSGSKFNRFFFSALAFIDTVVGNQPPHVPFYKFYSEWEQYFPPSFRRYIFQQRLRYLPSTFRLNNDPVLMTLPLGTSDYNPQGLIDPRSASTRVGVCNGIYLLLHRSLYKFVFST